MSLLEKIKIKLKNKIKIEDIRIVDNSHMHKKHKFFDPKKYHLKLIIKSQNLKKLKKIDSNRIIYAALEEEMQNDIHALQIEII